MPAVLEPPPLFLSCVAESVLVALAARVMTTVLPGAALVTRTGESLVDDAVDEDDDVPDDEDEDCDVEEDEELDELVPS